MMKVASYTLKAEGFITINELNAGHHELRDGELIDVIDSEGRQLSAMFAGTYPHGNFHQIGTCADVYPQFLRRVEHGRG